MPKVSIAQLGGLLRSRRGDRGLREVAAEIGVSPATLSRVERGHVPDLVTFKKLCEWLRVDPADVLGIRSSKATEQETPVAPVVASAHYRAGQTTKPEVAKALAELILAAERMLSQRAR